MNMEEHEMFADETGSSLMRSLHIFEMREETKIPGEILSAVTVGRLRFL